MSGNPVVELTSRLPAAGKHNVRYWFQKGREAARNADPSGRVHYAKALGASALLHGVQFLLGVSELARDRHASPAFIAIDALYTATSGLATYTQAYLGVKLMRTPLEESQVALAQDGDSTLGPSALDEKPEIIRGKPTSIETAIALGSQALFVATYHW